MEETENRVGQFFVNGTRLEGYRAPDEEKGLIRPVNRRDAAWMLYDRRRDGWLPVQAEVPAGVTAIGKSAFEACFGLTAVSLPDTVSRIGPDAFCRCFALARVRLPESLRVIQVAAFAWCESLQDISIPYGVETIGDGAFIGCTSLTRVRLPDTVKTLGRSAYVQCPGLQEIAVPEALRGQVRDAFGDLFPLAWRWLQGVLQVNAPVADVLAQFILGRPSSFWKRIVQEGDEAVLARYLAAWDTVPQDYLDRLIRRSQKAGKLVFTAMLLEYKNTHYRQVWPAGAQGTALAH